MILKRVAPFHLTLAVLSLLATALFLLFLKPYAYGVFDHALTLPFIRKSANAELFPNDYLFQYNSTYINYLHLVLGWLSHFINLKWIFAVLHALSIAFTFFTFGLIVRHFGGNLIGIFLSVSLSLLLDRTIGAFELLHNLLLNRTVVLPLLLGAWLLLLKRQSIAFLWLMALASLIHPLSALYWGIFFIPTFLELSKTWKRSTWLCSLLPVMVGTVPILWPYIQNSNAGSFQAADWWMNLISIRSGHHVLAAQWPIKQVVLFAAQVVLCTIIVAISRMSSKRSMLWGLYSIIGVLTLSIASAMYFPLKPLIQFSPLRAAVIPLVMLLVLMAVLASKRKWYYRMLMLMGFCTLIWQFQEVYRQEMIQLLPLALLSLSAGVYVWASKPMLRELAVGSLALVLMASSLLKARTVYNLPSFEIAQERYWMEMQNEVHESTAIDAIIVTPPELEGFRIGSKRSLFGSIKDGAMIFYSEPFTAEWAQRMAALNVSLNGSTGITSGYRELSVNELQVRTSKYATVPLYAVIYAEQYNGTAPTLAQHGPYVLVRLH